MHLMKSLYVLMNGTGVGFSVERQYISQLPIIADQFHMTDTTITVADSKLGWANTQGTYWYVVHWSDSTMGFV